jgi:hypothetical protein
VAAELAVPQDDLSSVKLADYLVLYSVMSHETYHVAVSYRFQTVHS